MVFCGILKVFRGVLWYSESVSWCFMVFYGVLWCFVVFYGVLWCFEGVLRVFCCALVLF